MWIAIILFINIWYFTKQKERITYLYLRYNHVELCIYIYLWKKLYALNLHVFFRKPTNNIDNEHGYTRPRTNGKAVCKELFPVPINRGENPSSRLSIWINLKYNFNIW